MFEAPNYTQTPNVFFDEIMKTLTEGELRVMLIIMRQTFGWRKTWDWITLSQMAEKTSMERRSVIRTLKNLIEKGLVTKKKVGVAGSQKCYYSLVTEEVVQEPIKDTDGIETEEEMEEFQKPYTSDRRVTPPVTVESPPPVTVGSPTKETYTKETTTTKSAAAVSSASEKEENPKAFFDCLTGVDIPKKEKVWLSQRYSQEVVERAVLWLNHPKTKIETTISQALKWACKEQPEIPVSKEEKQQQQENEQNKIILENKEWLKAQWQKKYENFIDVYEDRVQLKYHRGVLPIGYLDEEFKSAITKYIKNLK